MRASTVLAFLILTSGVAAAQSVEVNTERPLYQVGERIRFVITNNTTREAKINLLNVYGGPESFDGYERNDLDWRVAGGASKTWEWNRRDDDGTWANPGKYEVRIQYSLVNSAIQGLLPSAEFYVIPRYRESLIVRSLDGGGVIGDDGPEPTDFFVLNRSRSDASMASAAPWWVENTSGVRLYEPAVAQQRETLESGGGRRMWSWEWDINADGVWKDEFVGEGRYKIKVRITRPGQRRATTFTLPIELESGQ